MKKITFILLLLAAFFLYENYSSDFINADEPADNSNIIASTEDEERPEISTDFDSEYKFPRFYKGIYLNVATARNFKKLKKFVELSKKAYINVFVLDVQSSRYRKCIVPAKHIQYCIDNGIHPIARVVVFPEGLRYYPVSESVLRDKLDIAESACKSGFKEIQFDYIRFNDSNRLRHLSRKQRYKFIEGFLLRAKNHLKKYNAKIAADVFGRIPLNKGDLIGQRMEGLDEVVDIICPMAYPSHYTWSKKLQHNPYHTVYMTSKKANNRTKKAEIVTYIQAFKMRLGPNSYSSYIRDQIRACHDAEIRGFLFWNARQIYTVPFQVTRNYYSNKKI